MSTPTRRFASLTRLLPAALLMVALATPAAAQFGGLKKKIRAAAGAEDAKTGDAATQAGAPPASGATGGAVVLDEQVVSRLIAGLKAGQADREAAKKENTPYGRYHRDLAAYEAAKVKCSQEQQDFASRMAADDKLMQKYSGYTEKMVQAQQAGNNDLTLAYNDSAMAMQGADCVVKQPKQPDDYYDAQRQIDSRAEQQELKGSSLSRSEMAQARERAWMILQGQTPPGDASASEKSAVNSRAAELKPLLGIQEAPAARVSKPAPAVSPAPAPSASSGQPGMSDAQARMSNCMAQNAQKHEKEINALAQHAQAAQQANDMNKLMAIADSIQKLQTAGCQ
jgi:hypothetical protein